MNYSFQLYSARKNPDLNAVLGTLSRLGYTQVEGFGGLYADPAALAAMFKAHNLVMPTGHFGLDMLMDKSTTLKVAESLGVKAIFCPFIAPADRPSDDAGWTGFGEKLAQLCETYNAEGYQFGWHNHDFEFMPTASGRLPIDIILETAPALMWECDIAWVAKGKSDPVDWLKKYGPRINAVHVKDIASAGECLDEDGWADVGYGILDWSALLDTVKSVTTARYFVMEHDNPSDVDRFARRSIETLEKMGK